MTNIKYKDKFSLSARISESNRILSKHPGHIPVIVESMNTKKFAIVKNKFLVPRNVSAGHLLTSVRKQIKCNPNEAIFMFANDKMISSTMLMGELYEQYLRENINGEHSDNDMFYYVCVQSENTFGEKNDF
jgi:hypothetical protein